MFAISWAVDSFLRVAGESVSIHLEATLKLALTEMLADSVVTPVSLEFGTLSLMAVFRALRAENWLHHHGGMDHPRARYIKMCLCAGPWRSDARRFMEDVVQRPWVRGAEECVAIGARGTGAKRRGVADPGSRIRSESFTDRVGVVVALGVVMVRPSFI